MLSKINRKLIHYTKKAILDYRMIEPGDRVMVCLSGGKDSFSMVKLLKQIRLDMKCSFEMSVFTLDQKQPGWDDSQLRAWLEHENLSYHIRERDTYSVVKQKVPEGKTYCSLCSRLRRGNIYQYAKTEGFSKIALGHHRDDLVTSLMMSILYNGTIKSMPPKLLSDDKRNVIIRPLAYCQEKDIIEFASESQFPIIPCNLCGTQENLTRQKVRAWIDELGEHNPKIPSNILHAMQSLQPSQLMDQNWWDFKSLSAETIEEVCDS